jgi:ABC-type branched-subunit amino acid transport system ATPase component
MSVVLEVRDVHAGYGKARVLNGIDLAVGVKERVIVLGANGSGKSTLAKTLMGLTTLYSGAIEWNGDPIGAMPSWRRARLGLGYVPQVANVFRGMTVTENLLVGAHRVARHSLNGRLDMLYELFPMLHARRTVFAGNLSGGERRMLALATTLIEDPSLLILDEPTSDLAPAAIDIVFEKIEQVCATLELPLLMIEQNVERARELADPVCVLVRGRVALEQPADAVDQDEIAGIFLERGTSAGGIR